jgi:hypothetical protein
MRWMEACYGGTDVMERSCAVARGIDINMAVGFILVWGSLTGIILSKFASSDPTLPGGAPRIRGTDLLTVPIVQVILIQ